MDQELKKNIQEAWNVYVRNREGPQSFTRTMESYGVKGCILKRVKDTGYSLTLEIKGNRYSLPTTGVKNEKILDAAEALAAITKNRRKIEMHVSGDYSTKHRSDRYKLVTSK